MAPVWPARMKCCTPIGVRPVVAGISAAGGGRGDEGCMTRAEGRVAYVNDLQRSRQRHRKGHAHGVATFTCENAACATGIFTQEIDEAPGVKPAQPPAYCPRCRTEGAYVDWNDDLDGKGRPG